MRRKSRRHGPLLYLLLFQTGWIAAQTTTVNYTPHHLAIPNPERGFYAFSETHSNNYTPLNATWMAGLRNGYTPFLGNYTVPVTLIYRGFYLEDFLNAPISNAYLQNMQNDFDAARQAGVKLIVRMVYTQDFSPPYNDAPKHIVLNHIEQLGPLFTANADVMATVQAGFIGAWGEWCATDYFGDVCSPPYTLNSSNYNDRNDVVNALLHALPPHRTIQLRTPRYKQKAVHGPFAPVTAAATGGRIGIHNDCFLAPFFDSGTYVDADLGVHDTLHLKPYLEAEAALNVPIGGETCATNAIWHRCQSEGGMADVEMKRFRYSYLNADYSSAVNNSWLPCINSIENNLGYRFALSSGAYSNSTTPAGALNLSFTVSNTGNARPFNPRAAMFVLRNADTQQEWFAPIDTDPQNWPLTAPGTVSQTFCVPANMPVGDYELLLSLPDPLLSLSDRMEYAIQLANTGLWETTTGYNRLNHTVTISEGSGSCTGLTTFYTNTPLAVELSTFTGAATTEGVLLQWTTAAESDVRRFVVERSADGVYFDAVGYVSPHGSRIGYRFLDKDYPAGYLYYRIRTEDWDGSIDYSHIVSIRAMWSPRLHIYPNPARETFRVMLPGDETLSYIITDAAGMEIQTGHTSGGQISISTLPPGAYWLRLLSAKRFLSGRFVKY